MKEYSIIKTEKSGRKTKTDLAISHLTIQATDNDYVERKCTIGLDNSVSSAYTIKNDVAFMSERYKGTDIVKQICLIALCNVRHTMSKLNSTETYKSNRVAISKNEITVFGMRLSDDGCRACYDNTKQAYELCFNLFKDTEDWSGLLYEICIRLSKYFINTWRYAQCAIKHGGGTIGSGDIIKINNVPFRIDRIYMSESTDIYMVELSFRNGIELYTESQLIKFKNAVSAEEEAKFKNIFNLMSW